MRRERRKTTRAAEQLAARAALQRSWYYLTCHTVVSERSFCQIVCHVILREMHDASLADTLRSSPPVSSATDLLYTRILKSLCLKYIILLTVHRGFFGGRTLACRQVSPLRNVKWGRFLVLVLPPKAS